MRERLTTLVKRLLPPKGWRFRFWWPKEWWRRVGLVILYIVAPFYILDIILPPPLERAGHVSGVVMDRRGTVLRVFPVDDGKWRMQAHLKEIDPDFIEALLTYEDKRFMSHGGVDFAAMARADASTVIQCRSLIASSPPSSAARRTRRACSSTPPWRGAPTAASTPTPPPPRRTRTRTRRRCAC